MGPLFVSRIRLGRPAGGPLTPCRRLSCVDRLRLGYGNFRLSRGCPLLVLGKRPKVNGAAFLGGLNLSILKSRSLSGILSNCVPIFVRVSRCLSRRFSLGTVVGGRFRSYNFPRRSRFIRSTLGGKGFLVLVSNVSSKSAS